jgi:integrase
MNRPRHRNGGVRKVCGCPRRQWPKCRHGWYMNYKPKGVGQSYRLSIDAYVGKHVEGKTEAAKVATGIKASIDAGTFKTRKEAAADSVRQAGSPPTSADAITLAAFGQTFLERAGKGATANNRACLSKLTAFPMGNGTLGGKPLGAITEDDVEAFFASLRKEGRAGSTINKYVQLVRALFRWAMKKKYLDQNPIADSEAIKREKIAQRHRRLVEDAINPKTDKLEREGEERSLLAAAAPHLQRLIIGALETGMRLGELLRVQWCDVDLERRRLTIPAEKTKTGKERVVPINSRLAGVLEMAHSALTATLPDSLKTRERDALVAQGYAFGDGIGQRVKCVRKAWDTAVLKSHGHTPAWVGSNTLAPECRAALRSIDLHFHDLRHEAGSRFHEAGWPLHHVQYLLGHQSLEQTTTYLNVNLTGLEESMRRFDESVARCKPVANPDPVERAPLGNGAAQMGVQVQIN